MCKDALHDLLVDLPKCEHHIHIEGSLAPELLFRLAAQNGIPLPAADKDPAFAGVEALYERYRNFTSLDDFLHYYFIGFSVLLTAADFEELGYAYFAKAHAQNVRHAEVFFDPQAHTARGVAYGTVVDGLRRARRRAEADFGMTVEYIVCLLRHCPVDDAMRMFLEARDAGHFRDGTIAGLGMSSSEAPYPPAMFRPVYDAARDSGIRRTAHVGEEGPAAFVVSALDDLDVERVDHGRRAAEDDALLTRLAGRKTLLSLCPVSNVVLRGVREMREMPIRTFLDRGVRFSINSDDPAYFGGYILENYCAVQEAFGLSVDEWRGIATGAVEGSWCSAARKGELVKEVEAVVARHRGLLATTKAA
ncbi:Putative adenosine deaminase domain, adenosine/adenine deaminase, adenosine/AMP deaminase active [Colletotrichum destructivum]|uniref:Adenine deaminase n=1 Tax=Colletotrichum destructivum TaxID=34406 RepID=A0AAX4IGB5_9PEZI|nr:Putative adenosine deaminase domain, adenosine/adenine deaminase, adenosine/AMP deaminase active [Colletotrichum destructivum]